MSLIMKRLCMGVCAPLAFSFLLVACGAVKFSAQGTTDATGTPIVPEATPTPPGGGGTPTPTPPAPTPTPPSGGTPTPTPVAPTPTPGGTPRAVTNTTTVPVTSNNVDILLIIDDSGSMDADQKKLSAKLANFASMLENQAVLPIDWQMCVTVTRAQSIAGRTGTFWGASINWVGYTPPAGTPQYVLKKGATNLSGIFTSTINAIGSGVAGSNDERAIKAAYKHFYNGDPNASDGSGCYRKGASVAVITISDEDERSVGGDASRVKNYAPLYEDASSYQVLEAEDLPANLLQQARTIFGTTVKFSFNSIVVNNKTCEDSQDAEKDSSGHYGPSHMGTKYIEMSNLSAGGVGSICDADYSANLNLFKDKISNSLGSVTLECAPVANSLTVKIDGTTTTSYTLTGANVQFSSAVSEGKQITVSYTCTQ
jgi:hypothetical protein